MQVTTARTTNLGYAIALDEPAQGVRTLQNVVLSELPGVTFAVITLVYVLTALIGI